MHACLLGTKPLRDTPLQERQEGKGFWCSEEFAVRRGVFAGCSNGRGAGPESIGGWGHSGSRKKPDVNCRQWTRIWAEPGALWMELGVLLMELGSLGWVLVLQAEPRALWDEPGTQGRI